MGYAYLNFNISQVCFNLGQPRLGLMMKMTLSILYLSILQNLQQDIGGVKTKNLGAGVQNSTKVTK